MYYSQAHAQVMEAENSITLSIRMYQLMALRWHSEMIMGLFMNILATTVNA